MAKELTPKERRALDDKTRVERGDVALGKLRDVGRRLTQVSKEELEEEEQKWKKRR